MDDLDEELAYVNDEVVKVDEVALRNKALKKFDDIMQFFND